MITALVVLIVGGAALFAFGFHAIFRGVSDIATTAQERHSGDPVAALMSMLRSEEATSAEKNRAIWALGQIGDPRALPLLHELDTDEMQPKPFRSSEYIVQYSVEKAIYQIESELIVTRWMYRWL